MPAHLYRLSRLRPLLVGGLAGLACLTTCADAGAAPVATLRVTVFDYAALLGTAGHGDHGVMQAGWSVRDLQRGPTTAWRFSPDEGARLRIAARARQ